MKRGVVTSADDDDDHINMKSLTDAKITTASSPYNKKFASSESYITKIKSGRIVSHTILSNKDDDDDDDDGDTTTTTKRRKNKDEIWDNYYSRLEAFQKKNGHCHIPPPTSPEKGTEEKHEYTDLYYWMEEQRRELRRLENKMTDTYGHPRNDGNDDDNTMSSSLPSLSSSASTISSFAPQHHSDNIQTFLTSKRINQLNQIHFEWQRPGDVRWESKYQQLKRYYLCHGHCNVPPPSPSSSGTIITTTTTSRKRKIQQGPEQNLQDDQSLSSSSLPNNDNDDTEDNLKQLYRFVTKQRYLYQCYNKGLPSPGMNISRINALNRIKFRWNYIDDTKWMAKFQQLKDYKELYGHVDVPRNPPSSSCKLKDVIVQEKSLGRWVSYQRNQYKMYHEKEKNSNHHQIVTSLSSSSSLSPQKIQLLESIGFLWKSKKDSGNGTSWEKHYILLVQFKREHGHVNVPKNCASCPALGTWVRNQRAQYKVLMSSSSQPSPEIRSRIEKLEDLGFKWTLRRSSKSSNTSSNNDGTHKEKNDGAKKKSIDTTTQVKMSPTDHVKTIKDTATIIRDAKKTKLTNMKLRCGKCIDPFSQNEKKNSENNKTDNWNKSDSITKESNTKMNRTNKNKKINNEELDDNECNHQLSEYELYRLEKIRRNQEYLAKLGLE